VSILTALLKALWAFFRTYILRRGFLDGREGFLIAVATAESTFYRYVKLAYPEGGVALTSGDAKAEP
jgi:hypothetical protein